MASGLLFDPKKALLLAPLVSSTGSLVYAWDQDLFWRMLTHKDVATRADRLMPTYWRVMLPGGLTQVLVLLGVTTWTSVAGIIMHKPLLRARGALPWYIATASLAVGHLVFGPFVARIIREIMDDEGRPQKEERRTRNIEAQKRWLWFNFVRMLTTDIGAWACACVAVTKTFSL